MQSEVSDASVTSSAGIESRCPSLRWLFRGLAAALGIAQIVVGRNTFGPDARSYLEIARSILRHDWPMTINTYWGPLYSWLLAAVLGAVKPSLRQEFPVAHALAFPIYLACIAAFEFFWTALLQHRQLRADRLGLTNPPIPAAQMWVLGYSLFIWLTVGDVILLINPDLCVATIVLLAAGLLTRIEISRNDPRSFYVWLGICLGFGYLAKAILFPMAFVFLGTTAVSGSSFSGREWRRRIGCVALAGMIFAAIALPEIILLSRAKGRITFSDTGRLNFAWYNYNIPDRNWQGEPAGSGSPAHPTRRIYQHPAVYEFNGPLRASYPPWNDPSYWNEGLSPRFDLRTVAKHASSEVWQLGRLLVHPSAWWLGLVLILLGSDLFSFQFDHSVPQTLRGVVANWRFSFISVVALTLYCLTLVQSRFLPGWELLLWGPVLAGIRLRPAMARFCGWVTALVSLALVGAVCHLVFGESTRGFHNDATAEYVTAEGLKKMGLVPEDRVGAIGFNNDAHWAYLAQLSIVAEINADDTCLFWSESPGAQAQVLERFARAGAKVVVANAGDGIQSTSRADAIRLAACARPGPGWKQIAGSRNYAFFLQ